MTLRTGLLALAALLAAAPARGQTLRRAQPKAFPLSVTPFLALGWGGTRGAEPDTAICGTTNCVEHKVGSGPHVGLDVQVPLGGTFGLALAGTAGRPTRVVCALQCIAPERVTAIHGSALVLWRFKARAPIYFGLGPAMSYVRPGPVRTQTAAVTEIGGAGVIAYDFRFSPTLGGRVAWWNYLVKPSEEQLGTNITPSGLAWDTQIALGVRFLLGS